MKVAQLCPTLCNLMDYIVPGIPQARIPEWVAAPFSRGSSQPRDQTQVSHIAGRFFTSWAIREAQEYWSGWPIPSPVDLPNPGIELGSLALQADSLLAELLAKPKRNKPDPYSSWASLVAQLVKNPSAVQETWFWFLGWADPLEKRKVTHSSILAWRIP